MYAYAYFLYIDKIKIVWPAMIGLKESFPMIYVLHHMVPLRFRSLDTPFNCREEANLAAASFYLREVKDDNKVILEDKDLEVIGVPNVRYDDVTVIAQHMETGFWLSYKAYQVKKKGVGLVEEKRVILHEEGRMDDGCEFARSQEEEARTARVIRYLAY